MQPALPPTPAFRVRREGEGVQNPDATKIAGVDDNYPPACLPHTPGYDRVPWQRRASLTPGYRSVSSPSFGNRAVNNGPMVRWSDGPLALRAWVAENIFRLGIILKRTSD